MEFHSIYPRENFAAINHAIKDYSKFNSQTNYFMYIIDTLVNYDTKDTNKPIKVINPIYTNDILDDRVDRILKKYHVQSSIPENSIKFTYKLDLNQKQTAIAKDLAYNGFWSLDRLFDRILYLLIKTNTEYIELPLDKFERATINQANGSRRFDEYVKNVN